ncbi:MAG TPA: RNA-binding domain-containing protein [Candidatus Thermoplasmatota archaeon]|nr:RNA-binding domain-containing protein [Candidatus Thermoplasmatota archaeon]
MEEPPGRARAPRALPFQRASVHVFGHATERIEKVEEALRAVVGPAPVRQRRVTGHHGNPIQHLEAELSGGDLRRTMEALRERHGPKLAAEADARLSDDLWFYVRFDKQRAAQGEIVVAQVDDAIRLRAKVKTFPANRASALLALGDYFGGQI